MEKLVYYKLGTKTNTLVSYKILDKDGDVLSDIESSAYFSAITYAKLPVGACKIIFYRLEQTIPYDFKTIKKWIAELNDNGFPCFVEKIGNTVNFIINIADFKYKLVLNSCLQLIRCLTESYIVFIVENYFRILSTNPNQDKFITLQEAHRTVEDFYDVGYLNNNHVITGSYEQYNNITKETFLKRVKKNGVPVTGHTGAALDETWAGTIK